MQRIPLDTRVDLDPRDPRVLRVLVVADDPLVRTSFVSELGSIVAGGAPGDERLARVLPTSDASVILWDLGPDPARVAGLLHHFEGTELPIVALAPDRASAEAALGAGAAGVLLRDAEPAALRAALEACCCGLMVLAPSLVPSLSPKREPVEALPSQLTPREREVLQLLAAGLSNKQIGEGLGISPHTAKFHVNAILAKLDAQTRTEAVVRAVQHGLLIL